MERQQINKQGEAQFSQLFKGAYLTNYSWGEATLAELLGNY